MSGKPLSSVSETKSEPGKTPDEVAAELGKLSVESSSTVRTRMDDSSAEGMSGPGAAIPRIQRRRSSVRMREQWQQDYASRLRRGEGEWAQDRAIEVFDLSSIEGAMGLQGLEMDGDRCLLVLPEYAVEQKKGGLVTTDVSLDTKSEGDTMATDRKYTALLLPMLTPSMGRPCIDIRQLHGRTGLTTYDPGFMSTSSCHSAITYIDGPGGRLLHRGYSIQDVCERADFVSLSFLLLYGQWPSNESDYREHQSQIKKHRLVHEKIIQFYQGFNHDAHPMAIMCAVVGGLSAFYHDSVDLSNPDHRLLCAYRLIAKMPTLAAMAYKTSVGQPIVYPKSCYGFAENFLYMMFALPSEEYSVNPVIARALDTFLMLHADHEQNASTSTVRIAGSSHANPFACIASGITALWGPAHGGANEAVLKMLEEIGTKDNIGKCIERAKDKKDPFRLMGFGHRVYKNYDPRAKVMQGVCHEVLSELKIDDDPLLELAMELEKVALNDEYFVKRRLFPNVDFYSGIVLKAMGIPVSMYTVLFAVARTVGWISQWKEMIEDPKQRIGRPRQLFVGEPARKIPEDGSVYCGKA